jgi:late competence protein required for DNA uptake (superfamily II DNA/RNA helicase)
MNDRYTYFGHDGRNRCTRCRVYLAVISLDEINVRLCRSCIEITRATLKTAYKEVMADHPKHRVVRHRGGNDESK